MRIKKIESKKWISQILFDLLRIILNYFQIQPKKGFVDISFFLYIFNAFLYIEFAFLFSKYDDINVQLPPISWINFFNKLTSFSDHGRGFVMVSFNLFWIFGAVAGLT